MNELTTKLAAITQEIGAIKKEKKQGSTVNYAFRGIDDIMNKLNPMLAKHGITLQNKVLHQELKMREFVNKYNENKIAYCAVAHIQMIFSDGVNSEFWEEVAMSEDYGDKAMTQAMSMAYKYAITRKFCILTEDLVDPDSREPNRAEEQRINKPTESKQATTNEANPDNLTWLNKYQDKAKTTLTLEFTKVAEALKSGKYTMTDIRKKYKVSKITEEELNEYIQ
jgi:ERF superfamily